MTNFEEIKRIIATMNTDELIEFCGGDTCENVLCSFVSDGDCCGNNCKVSYDCGGCIKKFLREFVKVTEYLEVKDNGRTVILCHYPIPCFKNHFYGSFHLYGHVHNSFEWNMMEHDKYLMEELYTTPCQMFNVGAMMPWMDYTPRTLDEIIAANSHNEAVRNK